MSFRKFSPHTCRGQVVVAECVLKKYEVCLAVINTVESCKEKQGPGSFEREVLTDSASNNVYSGERISKETSRDPTCGTTLM